MEKGPDIFAEISQLDFLDQGRARLFNGRGIEPVGIKRSILDIAREDSRLDFLDGFGRYTLQEAMRQPWIYLIDDTSEARNTEEGLFFVSGQTEHPDFPGLIDSTYMWEQEFDGVQITRKIDERLYKGHILGQASITRTPTFRDNKDYFEPTAPMTTAAYRYTKEPGKSIQSKDLRINFSLGTEPNLLSAFFNSQGQLRSFGYWAGSTEDIYTDAQDLNADYKDLMKRYPDEAEILTDWYVDQRATERLVPFMTGYVTENGIRYMPLVQGDLGFNTLPEIGFDDEYLGFNKPKVGKRYKDLTPAEVIDLFPKMESNTSFRFDDGVYSALIGDNPQRVNILSATRGGIFLPDIKASIAKNVRIDFIGALMSTKRHVAGGAAFEKLTKAPIRLQTPRLDYLDAVA